MRSGGSDALIGRVLADECPIESLLGQGAMGAVYRANAFVAESAVRAAIVGAASSVRNPKSQVTGSGGGTATANLAFESP